MNYMVFKFKFTLNYFYLLYKCCTKERSRVAVYVLRHYLLVSSDCSFGSNTTADTKQKQTGDERASLQLKSKQNILQLFICTEQSKCYKKQVPNFSGLTDYEGLFLADFTVDFRKAVRPLLHEITQRIRLLSSTGSPIPRS